MWKKILSSALVACMLLGGTAMALPAKVSAAAGAAVGVVNFGLLVSQHPETQKANDALQAEFAAAKQEFDSKAAGLNDQDKQALDRQLAQRVEQKRQELLGAIINKVYDAVKAVAEAKGLTIVVDKSAAIYGGTDITDEVGKKLAGKK